MRLAAHALRRRHSSSSEAFLCGLLSEIGKLALTHAMPDTHAPVVCEGEGWPSEALGLERLGFSSSEAGEIILRGWQVPEVVIVSAVVPHATTETLTAAGKRLRRTIEEHIVDLGPLGRQRVTASFGCALPADVTSAEDATKLVAAADVQLFAAKNLGRNRVAIAADPFVSA